MVYFYGENIIVRKQINKLMTINHNINLQNLKIIWTNYLNLLHSTGLISTSKIKYKFPLEPNFLVITVRYNKLVKKEIITLFL